MHFESSFATSTAIFMATGSSSFMKDILDSYWIVVVKIVTWAKWVKYHVMIKTKVWDFLQFHCGSCIEIWCAIRPHAYRTTFVE